MRNSLRLYMMTSSNDNIFRVTVPLCGEFAGEFPSQKPVTRSFDIFFDLRLNKRLNKQSWGWWFETPSCPLWHHCNELENCVSPVTTGSDKDLLDVLRQNIPQYGDRCLHPQKLETTKLNVKPLLGPLLIPNDRRIKPLVKLWLKCTYRTFCPALHWLSLILWDSAH